MKRFINLLLVALLLVGTAYAGDTYNKAVTVSAAGETFIVYKSTFTMPDSTGNYYTQGIPVGDCNAVDGTIRVVCSNVAGTEDVNGFLEYSYDNGSTWITGTTDANLDAIGTTAKTDTIGIVAGVDARDFHLAPLFRVKIDGQAGHPSSSIVTLYVAFQRDPVYVRPVPRAPNAINY